MPNRLTNINPTLYSSGQISLTCTEHNQITKTFSVNSHLTVIPTFHIWVYAI